MSYVGRERREKGCGRTKECGSNGLGERSNNKYNETIAGKRGGSIGRLKKRGGKRERGKY